MFRRSRFSARPNVGPVGRGAAAAPQEAPPAKQEASETPTDTSENNTATSAVVENKPDVTSEKAAAPEDGNDQNGEGTSSAAAVQRRKRFSVKPKVAPGRPAILSRTPKSPVKAISETPVESSGSGVETSLQTVSTRSGNTATTQGLQSPRRRRSSEGSKSPRVQPKPALVSSDGSEPAVVPPAEDSPEQTHLPSTSSDQSENASDCQVKEVPLVGHPDKVPPSLPDREANEISEKARTLVSTKTALSLTASAYSLSRLLNGPSDLQRLVKAQKLRELLKQERWKEKTLKKAKARSKEYSLDPTKMTMRDLIHYLPTSNPMSYDLEDSMQENETVLPPSPLRHASPEPAEEPEAPPNNTTNSGEGEEEGEDDQDDAVMVPQVKVAEDGSLIIDEESLTVEVQRAKGPNPAQDRDPIFERGSTTTYSSFRKGTYTKPWSSEETDMFFLAVSMVGTDFSMICQLFPHRARSEIKNKFKKEERLNAWRIDKAFKERRKLDIEYFSKLLEKILEVQKNRKKLKSLAEKNAPKQRKRKTAAKKPARRLSNVEEVDEEDEDEVPDLEEEGEKENEDLCNEEDVPAAEPKRKNKRKKKTDASTEEPHDKKSKAGNKSTEQAGEAGVPEDAEAALPEDHTNSDTTQDAVTDTNPVIKPAKLSRARAPKPTLPLGRKWGKKTAPSTKPKDAASEEEIVDGGALEEQVNKDASTSSEANKRKTADVDVSDEEEDVPVKPLRPTRYGRVPKPTKPLTYSDKDDAHSSASETSASSASAAKPKPKCTAKRGRPSKQPSTSKKPKLVTLQASRSEFSDEDYEEEDGQPQPSSSRTDDGAFVPTGLHTLQPEISEVDESMEELDILASMPDVLGISQEALCPDSSCEQAQHETDTAEPYEHQLDLLVDVIDFLSTEHTEVSEEQSYNEAAQTLLTIGNLAHIVQSAQNQDAVEDTKEGTSTDNNKPSNIEEQIASRPAIEEESASVSAQCDQDVTSSETATAVEVKATETHAGGVDMAVTKTSDLESPEQKTVMELEPEPESSNKNPPQTSKGRLSREKPKPNLARMSRAAQSKSQPEASPGEASHAVAPDVCQANAVKTAAQEIVPETQDCAPATLKVNLIDEPSCQETIAAVSDQTSSEIQSHLFTESKFDTSVSDANVTSESTNEKLADSTESSETSLKDSVTCDSTLTGVDQETVTDLTTDQERSDKSTHDVPHAEDSAVSKGEESEVETTRQSRRSRLQKFKPKLPQTSRTARSKAQTIKESVETESTSDLIKENLTPCSQTSETVPGTPVQQETDLQPAQKQEEESVVVATPVEEVPPTQEECTVSTGQMRRGRVQKLKPNISQTARTERSKPQSRKDLNVSPELDVETQPTEKLCEITDPASTINPLFNVDSTPKEPTPNEDKQSSRPEPSNQVDLIPSPSEERTSENKNLSIEHNIREPVSTSKSSDEILSAQLQTADVSCEDMLITHSSVTESQVGQDSNVYSTSVQFQTGQVDDPALAATLVKESPASQEESQAASSSQGKRGRLQKIKPKPILPQISCNRRSKCQTTNEPVEKESSLSTKMEVEQQQICPRSPENSHSTPPALTVISAVEQVTGDPLPTSSITEENPVSRVEAGESGNNDVVASDRADSDSQLGRGSNVHSSPVQVLKLSSPVKNRLQKIKPKPNLSQTRTVKHKPGPVEDLVAREQPVEETSVPTLRAETSDNTKVEVEMQPNCSSSLQETSNQTESPGTSVSDCVPSTEQETKDDTHGLALSSEGTVQASQRTRLSKVKHKPNLRLSTRTAQSKSPDVSQPPDHSLKDISSSATTEQPRSDTPKAHGDLKPIEKNDEHLPPAHSFSKEEPTTVKFDPGDCKLDTSAGTADPSTKQIIDPTADSSKDASTESIMLSTDVSSVYLEGNSTVESTDDVKSELIDSTQTSKKAPQTRRGRLIKPKPALGFSSSRRRQAQEAKGTNPTEPESGDSSLGVDDSGDHKREPEPRPDAQEPVEGVTDESLHQEPPPKDVEPSHGLMAQCAQPPQHGAETLSSKVAPSNTEEIQSHPVLQDLLLDNVPSDPNERFFILSLTEIPVPSLEEAASSAAEPPSHRTVTDTSRQQPIVSGECVSVTAGEPSSFSVVRSTEESAIEGRSDVKDKESGAAASNEPDSSQETGIVSLEPQKCSQSAENDEAAMTPAQQKPTGNGRRAKSQIKPIVMKKRQTRKAPDPNEPESAPSRAAQDSEHPGTSLQLRALDQDITEVQKGSSCDVDNESQRGADISSSAQMTQRTGTGSKMRAKAKAAQAGSPPPSKAASKGSKSKAPPAKRKQSSPEPAASTSHDFISTRQPKKIHAPTITSPTETEEPHTSVRRTAEVSDSQQRPVLISSPLEDQEPLSVSRYFLSNIFTDVEDE